MIGLLENAGSRSGKTCNLYRAQWLRAVGCCLFFFSGGQEERWWVRIGNCSMRCVIGSGFLGFIMETMGRWRDGGGWWGRSDSFAGLKVLFGLDRGWSMEEMS